jgi:hypothetical protein
MERGKSIAAVLALVLTLSVPWSEAFGGTAFPATANIIEVNATSGDHSATFTEIFPVSSFSGNLPWALQSPLTLSDGSYSLATFSDLAVNFNADPQVDLSFALINGNVSNPVNITITSATIIFDAVPNAQGAAGASITVGQGAGSPNGGSITGLFPGGKIYQARYSTDSILDTATVFATLDDSMTFSTIFGNSESDALPLDGSMLNLGTTVYMIESEFKFTLSPGDQASGTSTFLITPEPATLMLLVLGASALSRRFRRPVGQA